MMNKKVFALAGLLVFASNIANTTGNDKDKSTGKLAKCLQFAKNYGLMLAVAWQSHGFVTGLGSNPQVDVMLEKCKLNDGSIMYSQSTNWNKGFNLSTLNVGYTVGATLRANDKSNPFSKFISALAQWACGNLANKEPKTD